MISQALIYTIIAYIGSCIAGIMLIPQVYLTIKTKKTDDNTKLRNSAICETIINRCLRTQIYAN